MVIPSRTGFEPMQETAQCPECHGVIINPEYPLACDCASFSWTRIDPEDEKTWPKEGASVWAELPEPETFLAKPSGKTFVGHIYWEARPWSLAALRWKPALVPERPEEG